MICELSVMRYTPSSLLLTKFYVLYLNMEIKYDRQREMINKRLRCQKYRTSLGKSDIVYSGREHCGNRKIMVIKKEVNSVQIIKGSEFQGESKRQPLHDDQALIIFGICNNTSYMVGISSNDPNQQIIFRSVEYIHMGLE